LKLAVEHGKEKHAFDKWRWERAGARCPVAAALSPPRRAEGSEARNGAGFKRSEH